MNNDEEIKALYKIMEHDGKITVNEINTITSKIDNATKAQLDAAQRLQYDKNHDSDGKA